MAEDKKINSHGDLQNVNSKSQYQSNDVKREEAERIYNSDLLAAPPKITLSKQEYAVLRKEVMRKNSASNGKVKPMNFAFTANYFYIYSTSGEDSFIPIKQFNIERDREKIDYWLSFFEE